MPQRESLVYSLFAHVKYSLKNFVLYAEDYANKDRAFFEVDSSSILTCITLLEYYFSMWQYISSKLTLRGEDLGTRS